MPTVLSVTMAVGARILARKQAVVSRLASIEEMAGMDVLCSDKTGTLTQNRLALGEPFALEGIAPEQVVLAAALASRTEAADAIDQAVLAGLKDRGSLSAFRVRHFQPFDPVHKRTEALLQRADGSQFKVSKGAPQVILQLAENASQIQPQVEKKISEFAVRGAAPDLHLSAIRERSPARFLTIERTVMDLADTLAREPKDAVFSPRAGALALSALGVVYGDIGTSPLYALRECFQAQGGLPLTQNNVLGVLSLVFWSLFAVISLKYVALVMRADNQGEGGILALLALAFPERKAMGARWFGVMTGLGLFGAALLYGDGMITPAISVLSAVEGLNVAAPYFKPVVIPLTIAILIGLFSFQHHGTGHVGKIFGPIMVVWFASLTVLGLKGLFQAPEVLAALYPGHALRFLIDNGFLSFAVLGSVFLVVTGGEALYADMGHFGRKPIQLAWFGLVFPSLVLNYFGQGALLLTHPEAAQSPFYQLAPEWAIYPLVALATVATVIASQALISGAFSLSMQGIQLGYSPRMQIEHTSPDEKGQVYVPRVNTWLLLACIGLVAGFQSSSRLAGAYGVAVTLTMIITTALFYFAAQRQWNWPAWKAGLVCTPFLIIESAFFGANSLKILHGGWVPLVVGGSLFFVMTTWKAGRRVLGKKLASGSLPLQDFLADPKLATMARVPGTAVYLSGNPDGTPISLLHNLRHNKVLHERVVLLTIETADVPRIDKSQRVEVKSLAQDFFQIVGTYGFMEDPVVLEVLGRSKEYGLEFVIQETTFFLSRQNVVSARGHGLARWRTKLFAFLLRNAEAPTDFFRLPANQVVELGMHIEI